MEYLIELIHATTSTLYILSTKMPHKNRISHLQLKENTPTSCIVDYTLLPPRSRFHRNILMIHLRIVTTKHNVNFFSSGFSFQKHITMTMMMSQGTTVAVVRNHLTFCSMSIQLDWIWINTRYEEGTLFCSLFPAERRFPPDHPNDT